MSLDSICSILCLLTSLVTFLILFTILQRRLTHQEDLIIKVARDAETFKRSRRERYVPSRTYNLASAYMDEPNHFLDSESKKLYVREKPAFVPDTNGPRSMLAFNWAMSEKDRQYIKDENSISGYRQENRFNRSFTPSSLVPPKGALPKETVTPEEVAVEEVAQEMAPVTPTVNAARRRRIPSYKREMNTNQEVTNIPETEVPEKITNENIGIPGANIRKDLNNETLDQPEIIQKPIVEAIVETPAEVEFSANPRTNALAAVELGKPSDELIDAEITEAFRQFRRTKGSRHML